MGLRTFRRFLRAQTRLGARAVMIYTGYIQTHLSLNRILLLIIGLWPYQQSRLIRVQFFLLFSILTTFILAQLGVFFTSRCTADVVLKILFNTFFFTVSVINYASFYVNSEMMKYLTDQIQCNYNGLKDENEIAIMDEYGNRTKCFTVVLTVFLACSLCGIYWIQFWPCILNVILPANKTRSVHILQFVTEYFLDQERHFYLMLLHENTTFCICGFVMVGTGTMLLAYGQHICGMFKIASYRIQYAIRPKVSQSAKPQNENSAYKRIIYAVDIHRKTLQFADILMSTFATWISLLIGFGVMSASLNLMRIFLALTSRYDIEELSIQFLVLAIHYLYMFLANFVAQEVTDHNNHVFATVYNIQWYVAPLQIQKMILFLLQNGTKAYYLQLGSLFVGSLEGFASLLSASISYFTVIYSMQQ